MAVVWLFVLLIFHSAFPAYPVHPLFWFLCVPFLAQDYRDGQRRKEWALEIIMFLKKYRWR